MQALICRFNLLVLLSEKQRSHFHHFIYNVYSFLSSKNQFYKNTEVVNARI